MLSASNLQESCLKAEELRRNFLSSSSAVRRFIQQALICKICVPLPSGVLGEGKACVPAAKSKQITITLS